MSDLNQNMRGLVLDIDRFSVHDGPGIRTAVFLKGCPMHCAWCHSPESMDIVPELLYQASRCTGCAACVPVCPHQAIKAPQHAENLSSSSEAKPVLVDWSFCTDCGACAQVCYPGALKMAGDWMTVHQVAAEIEKDSVFFQASGGGVTLTGGEITRQINFSEQVLSACRKMGIHTAVETNGFAAESSIRRLIEVTDLFLYDLKILDDHEHQRWTGVSNQMILANLEYLASTGARVVVRVPCIPGISDTNENISSIGQYIRNLGLSEIHLLPYNYSAGAKYTWIGKSYPLIHLDTQPPQVMQKLATICEGLGLSVKIGG